MMKTPNPPGAREKMRAYTTRNIPASYIDRIRILAALERTTLEHQFNRALSIGISALEMDRRKKHQADAG